MNNFIKIINKLSKSITALASAMLFIMLVITFVQVIFRYCFNSPIMWAEEITLVMLIWFGYMVISVGVWEQRHIALESLYLKLNRNVQRVLDGIRHILLTGFSILMIYYGLDLVELAKKQYLPASHLNRGWLYAILIVSGGLMVLYSLTNLAKLLVNYKEEEV